VTNLPVQPKTYLTIIAEIKASLAKTGIKCGFHIGNAADKSTWRLEFVPGTSPERKAILQKVIDDFPIDFNASHQ